jgi:hypothetical protein
MLGLLSASSGDIDRGVGKQEHETLASVGGANLKVVSVGWRRGGCADSGRTNEQSAMGTGGVVAGGADEPLCCRAAVQRASSRDHSPPRRQLQLISYEATKAWSSTMVTQSSMVTTATHLNKGFSDHDVVKEVAVLPVRRSAVSRKCPPCPEISKVFFHARALHVFVRRMKVKL